MDVDSLRVVIVFILKVFNVDGVFGAGWFLKFKRCKYEMDGLSRHLGEFMSGVDQLPVFPYNMGWS